MSSHYFPGIKIGIVGGGQLGRMLIQSGIDLNIHFCVLDPDPKASCSKISEFTVGKLTDYDSVMAFGRQCDVITIEIENVNTRALRDLQREGKKVFPEPEIIELIQDKRKQKIFYKENGLPTAEFELTENSQEVLAKKAMIPMVNKLGKEGYDGRGVQIIRDEKSLSQAFDAPGLVEKLIDFKKEISVIVARNSAGEIKTFPAVEMMFHPTGNMVEFLFSPAEISEQAAAKASKIASEVIQKLNMTGLLAVEMFLTHEEEILINEIAPRPHNSGHQTIEGNETSQYQQHLRAILNLPLGDTSVRIPTAMINLLGDTGYEGKAHYEGIEECMAAGAHIHLYGKEMTKPLRKMGHVTITGQDLDELRKRARFIKERLRVISK